jgi:hypothetical protein
LNGFAAGRRAGVDGDDAPPQVFAPQQRRDGDHRGGLLHIIVARDVRHALARFFI